MSIAKKEIEKKIAENSAVIFLLTNLPHPDSGEQYAYIAVRTDMVKDFTAALKKREASSSLGDYGLILESGNGAEPSQQVKDKMTEEWGFNHEGAADLSGGVNNRDS